MNRAHGFAHVTGHSSNIHCPPRILDFNFYNALLFRKSVTLNLGNLLTRHEKKNERLKEQVYSSTQSKRQSITAPFLLLIYLLS
jgi:hypothetical protein